MENRALRKVNRALYTELARDGKSADLEDSFVLANDLLFDEIHRAQVTIDTVSDGLIATDPKGVVELINPAACALLGVELADALDANLQTLLNLQSITADGEQDEVPDLGGIAMGRQQPPAKSLQLALHTRGGTVRIVQLRCSALTDKNGQSNGLSLALRDETAQASLSAKLSYEASHDPLTGIFNRREFERRLTQAVDRSKANGEQHALCYLDLDQFKIVNDTCGHAAGDELLRQITELLQARIRHADFLARIGGDEFGLILSNCNLDDASRVAQAICEDAEALRFNWGGRVFKVGISIGLVSITERELTADSALQRADAACYMAKEAGRGCVQVSQPGDAKAVRRSGEIRWVSELQSAMDEDRFVLAFQRIMPLQGDDSDGWAEMLARVRSADPEQTHMPGAFLPAAERYGVAHLVDQWITSRCLRWLHEGSALREGITRCSINLSGATLSKESFLYFVEEQLERYPVPAEHLCFEVTETAAISNLRAARKFFERFKARGCTFALDDFGSGMSSFGYLRDLPVDYLKIDGTFVRNMGRNALDYEFVRSIHSIGKTMGLMTIAEYVEDLKVLRLLQDMGVDYGQGYFLHQPAHATMSGEKPKEV